MGQGTERVEVRQPNSSFTVTVELLGLPRGCTAVASETSSGPHPPPLAEKVGEIRNVFASDVNVIKLFAAELKDNPNNQGFIFVGHPAGLTKDEMNVRERRLANVLRKEDLDTFDGPRVTIVTRENTSDFAEFWRVPPGASNPLCGICESAADSGPATGDLVMTDEFGDISIKDELGRLDLLAVEWRANPSHYLYFYIYRGPAESAASEEARIMRIRNRLIEKRGIPRKHIVIFGGGTAPHSSTRIYTVPAAARQHMPNRPI